MLQTGKKMLSLIAAIAIAVSAAGSVSYAEESNEAATDAENYGTKVFRIPIVRDGEAQDEADGEVRLMSVDENPTVVEVNTDDLYAGLTEFKVELEVTNPKDIREKLTAKIVDENENVVAQQKGVYYGEQYQSYVDSEWVDTVRIIYMMDVIKSITPESYYHVELTYSGKYTLNNEAGSALIRPVTAAGIRDIEVLDKSLNEYRFTLSNAQPGEEYKLYYCTYSDEIEKTATVDSNGCVTVEFGGEFYMWAEIYLCEVTATNYYECLSSVYLSDFLPYGYDDDNDYSIDGMYVSQYISVNDNFVWASLYEKNFGYAIYREDDLPQIDAYMIDMTTGERIGSMDSKEYYDEYEEIEVKIALSKALDETHKYGVVVSDGYTLRLYTDFTVTSKKVISNAWFDGPANRMPGGITEFFSYVESVNISDINNIKVELFDGNGVKVADSQYVSGNKFKTTASKPIPAGTYTCKATYGDITYSIPMMFIGEGGAKTAYQYVSETKIYNGKTYICATLQAEYNPANLRYVIDIGGGNTVAAHFGRSLFDRLNNYKCFVVVADEELTDVQEATLKIYDNDTYIAPLDEQNNRIWINSNNIMKNPFIYEQVNLTATNVEIYLEGIESATSQFKICAYDDVTGTEKVINANYDADKEALVIGKSQFDQITNLCTIGGWSNKRFFIERDGEFMAGFYCSELGRVVLDDSFGFSKKYTSDSVAVLNLPCVSYDYYRISESKADVSKQEYKKIEPGLLYKLSGADGEVKVYGQFKKADGTESIIKAAKIEVDTAAPVFNIVKGPEKSYAFDEYEQFRVEMKVDIDEQGRVYALFCDKDGNAVGYTRADRVLKGENDVIITFWADDCDYSNVAKLKIYAEDEAGNKTESIFIDGITVSGEEQILYGDVNKDGNVTAKDNAFLARYLANWTGYDETVIDSKAADVDTNGSVTAKDNAVLARHLANWTGYETLPYTK